MMDHNPYSPPQTEVREPLDPGDAVPRPKRVTLALWLLWAEFALSVVQGVVQLGPMMARPYFVGVIVFMVAVFIAEALVIYKLGMRRNWARYVTLIMTLLGLLQWLSVLTQKGKVDPIAEALEALELVLDSIALVLVFTTPGKQWFKGRAVN